MSDVPFDDENEFDDYELGSGVADGKTTAEIVKENSFPPIPKGRNDFFVKKIALKRDPDKGNAITLTRYPAWIAADEGGEATIQRAITCKDLIVTWAMVDDDRLALNQYLRAVPDDVDEAEIFAISARKEKGKIGMDYDMLRHVVGALGFEIVDGSIPVEAQRLGNWKAWDDGSPRIVSLDITEQRDQAKKPVLSPNGQPYMQIKFFSHQMSEDTKERLGLSEETQLDVEPPPPPAPTPARQAPSKSAQPSKPAPAASKATSPSQSAANKKRAF